MRFELMYGLGPLGSRRSPRQRHVLFAKAQSLGSLGSRRSPDLFIRCNRRHSGLVSLGSRRSLVLQTAELDAVRPGAVLDPSEADDLQTSTRRSLTSLEQRRLPLRDLLLLGPSLADGFLLGHLRGHLAPPLQARARDSDVLGFTLDADDLVPASAEGADHL